MMDGFLSVQRINNNSDELEVAPFILASTNRREAKNKNCSENPTRVRKKK